MRLKWHEVTRAEVEGRGWAEDIHLFTRLPDRAEPIVTTGVWFHSRSPAGLCVWFATDAETILADWSLRDHPTPDGRMTQLAHSGLDLYARPADARDQTLRWVAASPPLGRKTNGKVLRENLIPQLRHYCLYLPYLNPVTALAIGVPDGCKFEILPPRTERPIGYYGTSIVHGHDASRPGMTHAAQLSRRLNHPLLNLGFAGSALMELPLAELLAELDPCIWLIDPVPNMGPEEINERAERFIRILREARPTTPIVMIEDRVQAHAAFVQGMLEGHENNRAAWRRAFDRLRESGVEDLHYVSHEHLLGMDGDGTQDGSHPNELGFYRYTEVLEPVVRELMHSTVTT